MSGQVITTTYWFISNYTLATKTYRLSFKMHFIKLLVVIFIFYLNPAVSIASDNYNADIRYLHVQKGQTLHNIVKRLYPNRVKEWPKISHDIVHHNPHAFINKDATRMKAGVRLTLPQNMVMRAVPAKPQKREQVGVVIESSGNVIAVDKRKVSRKLYNKQPVYLGDKIITGENGSVRLRMIDEAVLDLRCFSIMLIEEYALNTSNRKSILNLLQGSLKKVTGKIGKMAEDVYELRTPLASIGIRGTEYALRVYQSRGCGGTVDADDGLYLEVIRGLVDVHNVAGKEVVAQGEAVYVALPKTVPQKVKIKLGVIQPVSDAADETSYWWWLLGIVALVLLI